MPKIQKAASVQDVQETGVIKKYHLLIFCWGFETTAVTDEEACRKFQEMVRRSKVRRKDHRIKLTAVGYVQPDGEVKDHPPPPLNYTVHRVYLSYSINSSEPPDRITIALPPNSKEPVGSQPRQVECSNGYRRGVNGYELADFPSRTRIQDGNRWRKLKATDLKLKHTVAAIDEGD